MRARTPTPLHLEMVRQGRTGKWLAARIGTNESELSRWRWGVHVPEPATQAAIAAALERPLDVVFPPDDDVVANVAA